MSGTSSNASVQSTRKRMYPDESDKGKRKHLEWCKGSILSKIPNICLIQEIDTTA